MPQQWKITGHVIRKPHNEGLEEVYDLVITQLPGAADHAVLRLISPEGEPVSNLKITVDDSGARASLTFEDRLDEATGPPISSDGQTPAVVQYTSDNTSAATIDPDSGVLAPTGAGSTNVGATVNDAITGAPMIEADGVTTFAPQPQSVEVDPGAAASDVFTVTDTEPAPAPSPTPTPTPVPTAEPVLDPATQTALYVAPAGDTDIQTPPWNPVTDVTDPGGATLYTFSGDTPGQPPAGITDGWTAYTGTPTPAS